MKLPRWCRTRLGRWGLSLAALSGLGAALLMLFLNQIKLPNFAVNKLSDFLERQGMQAEFEQIHWHKGLGFVAQGVNLKTSREQLDLTLRIEKLIVGTPSLLFDVSKLESIDIADGELELTFADLPDRPSVQASDLQAKASFLRSEQCLLEYFRFSFGGIDIELQGNLDHLSALGTLFDSPDGDPQRWRRIVTQIERELKSIDFASRPSLKAQVHLDAEDVTRSSGKLALRCDGAALPQGQAERLKIQADVRWVTDAFRSNWSLSLDRGQLRDNQVERLAFEAELTHNLSFTSLRAVASELRTGPVRFGDFQSAGFQLNTDTRLDNASRKDTAVGFDTSVEINLDRLNAPQLTTETLALSARISHQDFGTNGFTGDWKLEAAEARAQRIQLPRLDLAGQFEVSGNPGGLLDTLRRPWERNVSFRTTAERLTSPVLETGPVTLHARWEAPRLQVDRLQAELYEGELVYRGFWDPRARVIHLEEFYSDFDLQRIKPLLSEKGREQMDRYGFVDSPVVRLQGRVRFPDAGLPRSEWTQQFKQKLELTGKVQTKRANYRTIPVTSASSTVMLTNGIWRLSDLRVTRPEGELHLDYECDSATKDYRWTYRGTVMLPDLAPLMTSAQKAELEHFEFRQPLNLTGEARGRWRSPELTRFHTELATTNLLFRGVAVRALQADLSYVNRLIKATEVHIERDEGKFTADLIRADFNTRKVTLANAVSELDPAAIAQMLGPAVQRTFEPYRFARPPRIEADGMIPFDSRGPAQARFVVSGGPFAYWRFNTPQIRMELEWQDRRIRLENVTGQFYGGTLSGDLALDLKPESGALFRLNAIVENADLKALFRDIYSEDNESQGILNGRLTVSSGSTDDWNSWQGEGWVDLKDGLLWETPLFGIVSHTLNVFSPGLGNSRAESGTANFAIVDSVVQTQNLTIIQEPSTRLRYQGNLDFHGNLDARVEADLLRETPLLGHLISLVLTPFTKLFICQVDGTLADPQLRMVYVLPRLLTDPAGIITDPLNKSGPRPSPESLEPAATE